MTHSQTYLLIHIFIFALIATTLHAKTLTDTRGRSIEVDILKVGEDSVEVRRSDGYVFDIPFSSLSEESKKSLLESAESENETYDFAALNKLLELRLWKDANLWDDPADKVAKRLGWPQESKTATQSSYRVYFRKENPIAGARPYTAVLYGRNGKVDYLSIMFANKGDSVRPGSVEDIDEALDQVNEAIDTDLETISQRLDALGESQNEIGGISRGMKERAVRWDSGNNSFWLAAVEDEYIALRIMPPELAESWGRPAYQSDETVRQAAEDNVQENAFGDVLIQNIPMVNQGPKGYCVPATIERCLRYMGIRADMYTLAMAGRTTIGGGTSLSAIIDGTSAYVRRSSRDMETISEEVSIKNVSEYIDAGQPLMWTMSSTKAYNALANTITKQRSGVTDPKEWRKQLRDILRDAPKLNKDPRAGHLCMIVGYNDETDEIAVSDSWGPRFELRWITVEEANAVSNGRFYIIDF
jgi:hypothetical protein